MVVNTSKYASLCTKLRNEVSFQSGNHTLMCRCDKTLYNIILETGTSSYRFENTQKVVLLELY